MCYDARTSGSSVLQVHVRAVEEDVVIVVVRLRLERYCVSHVSWVILADPGAVTQSRLKGQLEHIHNEN